MGVGGRSPLFSTFTSSVSTYSSMSDDDSKPQNRSRLPQEPLQFRSVNPHQSNHHIFLPREIDRSVREAEVECLSSSSVLANPSYDDSNFEMSPRLSRSTLPLIDGQRQKRFIVHRFVYTDDGDPYTRPFLCRCQ